MANTELIHSFLSESEKLEKLLLEFQSNSITPDNVIPIYYQVINVKSMIEILKQDNGLTSVDIKKIDSINNLINTKFNHELHPSVLIDLDKLIQTLMLQLKTNKAKEKTKETIEQNAKDYEKLRQIMSTKEFVEQYDNGMKT